MSAEAIAIRALVNALLASSCACFDPTEYRDGRACPACDALGLFFKAPNHVPNVPEPARALVAQATREALEERKA